MQRRSIVQSVAGIAAGLVPFCAVTAPGYAPRILAGQSRSLRFGHLHSADSAIQTGLVRAASVLERASQGRLKLEVFPASQLGSALEMQKQMMEGSLDFILESAGAMANYQKSLSVLEAPFITRDWGHLVKMYESGFGRREFSELEKRRGIVRIGLWYYGLRHFTTSSVPLRTPDDARGLRLRVPQVPLYLDMVKALGATPTPMTLSEVYASLKSGATDGQENPLPTIFNNKFYEVQKYLNLTGHVMLALMPLTNSKLWSSLASQDKVLFKEALEEGGRISDQITRRQEDELQLLLKSKGMQIIESNRELFRRSMETVYAAFEDAWGLGVWQVMKILK
jgi:TRAP-type transport system periplasmic protein